jgi:hypothetical protein
LLSDGWKNGDPALLAEAGGTFHAVRSGSVACAWLGDDRRAFLWPAGYHVSFVPQAELLDANNHVIAREGEKAYFGGGGSPAQSATACAEAGEWTFSVMQ